MDFDTFTMALLVLRPDWTEVSEEATAAMQDAHMAYIAELHDADHLLAAGPLLGEPDEPFRGLLLLKVDADRTRQLLDEDPAVRAGRLSPKILPWRVPTGAMAFSHTHFARTLGEARGE